MEFRIRSIFLIVAFGIATVAGVASIDWHTVDGGGLMFMSGGNVKLSGTVGQHDAGTMTGGGFKLAGGFWAAPSTTSIPGDCDGDGDVDLDDFADFEVCLAGPDASLSPGCECFDLDEDFDIDVRDFAAFAEAYNTTQ